MFIFNFLSGMQKIQVLVKRFVFNFLLKDDFVSPSLILEKFYELVYISPSGRVKHMSK